MYIYIYIYIYMYVYAGPGQLRGGEAGAHARMARAPPPRVGPEEVI